MSMPVSLPTLSDDQSQAWERVSASARCRWDRPRHRPDRPHARHTRHGSGDHRQGRVRQDAAAGRADRALLHAAGVEIGHGRVRAPPSGATGAALAVLAPTNKAASVLRGRGVPATTLHRILYTPVYDPEYEKIAEWLTGTRPAPRPSRGWKPTRSTVRRRSMRRCPRCPARWRRPGCAGRISSPAGSGATTRSISGLVDESSMLDARQLDDLKRAVRHAGAVRRPRAAGPGRRQSGEMVFDKLPAPARLQAGTHAPPGAGQPDPRSRARAGRSGALILRHVRAHGPRRRRARDDPCAAGRARQHCDLMARSPVLVWRNATRLRLIHGVSRRAWRARRRAAARRAADLRRAGAAAQAPQAKRIDLEARGLIKGAQVVYLGPGRKPGFSRLHIFGAPEPQISVASIVKIESDPERATRSSPSPRRWARPSCMARRAPSTRRRARNGQRCRSSPPTCFAAARAGRSEGGIALVETACLCRHHPRRGPGCTGSSATAWRRPKTDLAHNRRSGP